MIRRALPEDAPACAAIVNRWIEETSWMPRVVSSASLEDMIRQGIPLREFWVIGDPVQGYLSFNTEAQQIMGLYTAMPGQGHGKALMDRVKQGRDFLRLRTHEANHAAHRFYQREGFVITDRIEQGGDGIAELEMQWRVGRPAGS